MLIKSRFLDACILGFIVLSTYNPTLGMVRKCLQITAGPERIANSSCVRPAGFLFALIKKLFFKMIFPNICAEILLKNLAVISHAAKGFMKIHVVVRHINNTPGNVGTMI